MQMRLGLAQCGFTGDGDVLAQVDRFSQDAAEQGVDLLVFPEDLMSPRPLDAAGLRELAEPLDGAFATHVASVAAARGMWVVFTMYERDPNGGAPFNTAVVVDDAGTLRGTYSKCHLYDAHGVCESERTKRGQALGTPIATPFWATLGVGICYDLRFPEQARTMALRGCSLLAYPSAWIDGPEKAAHWETLLRARAIENEVFVVGVCKAGERYVGRSMVVDPLGRVLCRGPEHEEALLTCNIELDEIEAARTAMPLIEHRRPELYR